MGLQEGRREAPAVELVDLSSRLLLLDELANSPALQTDNGVVPYALAVTDLDPPDRGCLNRAVRLTIDA